MVSKGLLRGHPAMAFELIVKDAERSKQQLEQGVRMFGRAYDEEKLPGIDRARP
jgi:hypothetical protein